MQLTQTQESNRTIAFKFFQFQYLTIFLKLNMTCDNSFFNTMPQVFTKPKRAIFSIKVPVLYRSQSQFWGLHK